MADTSVGEAVPLMFHPSRVPTRLDTRTKLQKKLAVSLILISAGLERLAFYSLAGNLTFFLTSDEIKWIFPNPIIASLIFLGTSYISALFFSWVSDGKLGRARTIGIGFIVYIIGYIFVALIANRSIHDRWCPGSADKTSATQKSFGKQPCIEFILPILTITAIGVGAVQANMAVFGAEQVREHKATTRYFDFYYGAVNTGGLVAYAAIAFLQLKSYFIGYVAPGGLLVLAFLCFLVGHKCYIYIKPFDSVVTNFFPVILNACQTWRRYGQSKTQADNHEAFSAETSLLKSDRISNDSLSFNASVPTWSFLDYAKIANKGRFIDREVDDIKSLRRVAAVFLLLIPYWLLYVQVETTFVVQGAHMRLPGGFKEMPVVWLSLGNQVIIIATIAVLNTVVYKRLQAAGRSFQMKTRILIGLVSAAVAMVLAGTVEVIRQDIYVNHNFIQTIGTANYTAADMSIFFQLPQYIGVGLSEVFTSVASLEFAYLAAPQSAQSLIMSLRFCSAGLSSFFGSAMIVLFSTQNKSDASQSIDNYRNDKIYYIYFFVLAGIQMVFVGIFLLCDHRFKIFKLPQNRLRPRMLVGSTSSSSNA